MQNLSDSALGLFEAEYASLSAIVARRIQLEWLSHPDRNLEKAGFQLFDYAIHFGRLLRVLYRHRLMNALREELLWYGAMFTAHGWDQDALALILDSWIIGVQGLIKPPECNQLAEPLHAVRNDLPLLFTKSQERCGRSRPSLDPFLVEDLLRGDIQNVQKRIVSTPEFLTSPDHLIADALLPAMSEIGTRWEFHQIEIYEEHLATEVLRILLARLPALLPVSNRHTGGTALVSSAPGDEHGLIPLALSSYLETRGWAVKNLGGSLPADQIIRAAGALRADVVFITFTMVFLLDGVLDVLDGLRRDVPSCKVIVGGRGTHYSRALLESRGAAVADDFAQGHQTALEALRHA